MPNLEGIAAEGRSLQEICVVHGVIFSSFLFGIPRKTNAGV